MTQPTVQVTATLIPVGQAFTAQPGQSIMVVAGVAIGVYTGKPVLSGAEPPAFPAEFKHPKGMNRLTLEQTLLDRAKAGHSLRGNVLRSQGVSDSAYYDALKRLTAAGKLTMTRHGTKTKDYSIPKEPNL